MIRITAFGLLTILLASSSLRAQDFEKQATDILKLYESGQRDTAYTLVEPLKQSARFVPAAIYVRAQMTPDDRALNLYREIIALEPSGAWADEAAYQLVRRYIDKRDSLASWTWFDALQRNYPQSPYVATAKSLLDDIVNWEIEMPEAEVKETVAAANPTPAKTGAKSTTTSSGTGAKSTTSSGTGAKSTTTSSGTGSKTSTSTGTASKTTTSSTTAASTSTEFSGYALQVGLFPTKSAAEKRLKELETKALRPKLFPKEVDGKTQYALVVGPYKSLEEAGKAKAGVSKACDCGAFTVTVE